MTVVLNNTSLESDSIEASMHHYLYYSGLVSGQVVGYGNVAFIVGGLDLGANAAVNTLYK